MKAIRDEFKLDFEQAEEHRNLTWAERDKMTLYYQWISRTGEKYDNLTPDEYFRDSGLVPLHRQKGYMRGHDLKPKAPFLIGRKKNKPINPRRFTLNKDNDVKIVIEKEDPDISIFKRNIW